MTIRLIKALTVFFMVALHAGAWAEQLTPEQRREEFRKLAWQKGPGPGAIGNKASISVPEESSFLPESQGQRFLELTGNLPEPGNSILVSGDWWATFAFSESGYIKDDEKLDADKLLKALQDGDAPANEERRKRGIQQLYTEGWVVPPHYDPDTKHLEWGLRLRAEGSSEPVINYTVRLLGRSGYESVILVSSPETLQNDVKQLKAVLKSFAYSSGERYDEFKPGDRVAEIGLGALVVGGAAAAAVKSGLWKSIVALLAASWKLVAAAVVALFAGLAKFFKRGKAE